MAKTNTQFLRDVIKELEIYDSEKASEANEFLDSVETELSEKDDEIRRLKNEIDEDDDDEDYYWANSDFVGLDTINWELDKGNLVIEQKMEAFINNLKRQNAVVPA